MEAFARGEISHVDSVLTTAESGAVLTMLYPQYSVVIPEGLLVNIPLVFAVQQREQEFVSLIDIWIRRKREDGVIGLLYNHWILGRGTDHKESPRWSVVRKLGWVK